jgi:hypothetical protein
MTIGLDRCEFCNSTTHHWFDCKSKPAGWRPERLRSAKKKPAKKSTAARKDVLATPKIALSDSKIGKDANEAKLPAGTQALPVDKGSLDHSHSDMEVKHEKGAGRSSSVILAKAEAAASHLAPLTKRGTPRQRAPKGTFDRKAYQREAARERRAKLKAEGKSK